MAWEQLLYTNQGHNWWFADARGDLDSIPRDSLTVGDIAIVAEDGGSFLRHEGDGQWSIWMRGRAGHPSN